MPNKNYRKGADKERRIVNEARDAGKLAFRSAGSHSPVDCVIVDRVHRTVTFIQSKPDSMPETARMKLLADMWWLNGNYTCEFVVR